MSLNYEGRTEKMKPLKVSLRKDGYLQINLSKNKKDKKYLVHRLVAENFIENKNNLPIVNHKNGFKKAII